MIDSLIALINLVYINWNNSPLQWEGINRQLQGRVMKLHHMNPLLDFQFSKSDTTLKLTTAYMIVCQTLPNGLALCWVVGPWCCAGARTSLGSFPRLVGCFSPRWIKVVFFRTHPRKTVWPKTALNLAHAVHESPSIQFQADFVFLSTFLHTPVTFRNMQHNSLVVLL